jgi:hypothetical protein
VRLPLSFEANQGQADSRVRYLARGPGYTVFLTKEEAVLALKPGADRSRSRGGEASHPRSQGAVVRIQPVGANPGAGIQPLERLPGTSNYFIGTDRAKWRTGIPTYAKVKYEGIHPGIDLVYYGNQRRLECDFIVAPGADPSSIGLAFQGIDDLELGSQGDLILKVKGGEVRMHKPFVYQVAEDRRREVPGDYVLRDKNQVGFVVAAYDTGKPLVIDPAITFSTFLGGAGEDSANGIFVGSSGIYLTGSTTSLAPNPFPTTPGAFQPTNGGSGPADAFVTKLNAAGTALLYSTYLGGADEDVGKSIYVDGAGFAYVTGSTKSSPTVAGFPATPGAYQTVYGGSGDAFVTKLNDTGTALVYSTYLGGSGADVGNSIYVDGAGFAYVTGSTTSDPFPTTLGAFQTTFGGTEDAFVTKLNPTGTAPLVYSTYLGGSSVDVGNSIYVDGFGQAYVTGSTQSSGAAPGGFPTQGAFQTDNGGSTDAFVTKLNAAGMALLYSTYLGGSSNDIGNSIYVDGAGQAYVTGSTQSSGAAPGGFPTQGAFQTDNGGSTDAFVTKLNAAGTALLYSTYLGGSSNDIGNSIYVNGGNASVTGSTQSSDFPTTSGARSYGGSGDAFVAKINPAGTGASDLVYSTYLGGSSTDVGKAISVDSFGDAYVAGSTQSSEFPVTSGAFDTSYGGSGDAFVAKITESGTMPPVTTEGSASGGGGGCFIATASAFEARK